MQVSLQNVIEMPNAFLFVEQVNKYLVVDENKKMEFINGEIFFQSPVKLQHNNVTVLLGMLMKAFVAKHQFGFVGVEKIMISLTRNDYEPDICFFGLNKSKLFKKKQIQFPAPDFLVEVLSDSTAKNDRETKFQDYAAHGVQEYWIIDADKEIIEQYVLTEQSYELYRKSNDGNIESVVLQGFTIPIRAVFDEKLNIEVLSKILS